MTKVNYTVPEAGVPERQLKLLRPYLLGDRPREDGEWDMFCPLHEDTDRSSQLNIDTGLWYCFKCEEGGTVSQLIRKKDDWFDPPAHRNGDGSEPAGRYAKREEEVTPAMVAGWHAALMANEALLDDLQTLRGLWTKTLIDFEIGWDGARKVYTIPVYDAEGTLLNVRRYNPRPPEIGRAHV